jgi:hypothetical protein
MVMVLSDEGSVLPPPTGGRDVVISTALEPSPVAGAASVEDVMDLAACRYVDFPGIGTVDLDALNSRATTERCWEVQDASLP